MHSTLIKGEKKVNDNAYKVDLPSEYDVSAPFNVSNLSLFDVGDGSRSNRFEKRGDGAIQSIPNNLLKVPVRPIIRSKVKKLEDAFNELIQSIWTKMNLNKGISLISDDQTLVNLIYVQEGPDPSIT